MTLTVDVFLNLETPKMWLDECLESPVSEVSSTSNMVNVGKHCSKLNGSTFTIFIDPFQGNSSRKIFSD